MAVLLQPFREFSGRRCFTGTLQTDEHDDRRRLRREIDPDVRPAEHLDQFVANDLHDLLAGTQALQHFLAQRLGLHGVGELLDDLEIDVRFQQRDPDFFQRLFDVQFA